MCLAHSAVVELEGGGPHAPDELTVDELVGLSVGCAQQDVGVHRYRT
jgi:hypothetical protein